MSKRTAPVPLDHFPASLAPVGSVTSNCCPKMVGVPTWWDTGPVTTQGNNYRGWTVDSVVVSPSTFGFDDRTNMPAVDNRGSAEYWNRPGAPGTSGGRRDLDGSSWVSVPVGATADVEIRFVGHAGTACIGRVTLQVDDASKAKVSPASFNAASAKLTITGVAEGECTITAMCNSKPIGWFHAAVYAPKTGNVGVWRVNLTDAAGTTNLTSAAPLSAADMITIVTTLDTVYSQCAISWNVTNNGVITYTNPASVTLYNDTLAQSKAPPGIKNPFFDLIAAQNPAATALPSRNVYFLEPQVFASGVSSYADSGGVAQLIPGVSCLVYAPLSTPWGRDILAHELGHCLGLYHPNDSRSASKRLGLPKQLPNNFRLPLAKDSGGSDVNGMWADFINMMGYDAGPPPNSAIRYGQWEAVRANI